MADMIDGLLTISRISTRAHSFQLIELDNVISGVLNDLEVSIERTGGHVEVDHFPSIEAEPLMMQQLFQNLIGNALKFHKQGVPPEVKVRCQEIQASNGAAGGIEISVEDNGIGFDEKNLGQVFQPFRRLVGRSQYDGSGMGLAICRKIVERHGGTITASSSLGVGSKFIVKLPVAQK